MAEVRFRIVRQGDSVSVAIGMTRPLAEALRSLAHPFDVDDG